MAGQLADLASVFTGRADLVQASSRLTIAQLAELRGLEPDLQLLDVRGAAETAGGTLAGAIEIPLVVLADSLDTLDRQSPVVIYCASGYRSIMAASLLAHAAFTDVSDLLGGYGAWAAAGLPVATPGGSAPRDPAVQVNVRAARLLLEDGAMLLDVREPDEWAEGHAPDAVLIPMAEVQARRNDLPQDRQIVVVCRSGGRSAAVTDTLRVAGYNAVNLTGGMCAWTAAGLPVVHPAATKTSDSSEAHRQAAEHGMVVHRADPLNVETSLTALMGGVVVPNTHFYVRNHFGAPAIDADTWRLHVGGLVERPLTLSLRELSRLPSQTRVLTLECAGNGRHTLIPPVEGEPWRFGAVSTAEWTGVALTEVLDRVGQLPAATEILFRGADRGTINGAGPIHFERSLTIDTARRAEPLLAYAMNGELLPLQHGYPVRLIVPGWYGVASVKWISDINLIDHPFDGYFQADRYWYETEDGRSAPVTLQRVRALITEPFDGEQLAAGDLTLRGIAWSGAAPIDRVDVSIHHGAWQRARLIGAPEAHHWQWWELPARISQAGHTSIRAKTTDASGSTQPKTPEWNRHGYGNNAIQEVTVTIT